MQTAERNPFPVYYNGDDGSQLIRGWKWFDETGQDCERMFSTQEAALRDLMKYMKWLNHGPTLWQRVWWPIRYKLVPLLKRFWQDQGHATRKSRVTKL